MKEFEIIKHSAAPKLKNPVLIEGLPGIGNVARIAVDFLVEKLKAKKYATIYSVYFPNSVFVNDDKTVEMPKLELYWYKAKKPSERDAIFLIGDAQPGNEKASYNFSKYLVDLAAELGTKEIITLGGINAQQSIRKPPVFGAVTDKDYVSKLQKIGVRFDRKGAVVIVGAAGLMLSLGKIQKMKGFALLAETSADPRAIGLFAAESILETLVKYLNIKISLNDIRADIRTMTTGIPAKKDVLKKKLIKRFNLPQEATPTHYIG
ncbi:MAG: PAC2 family protein [Candidatus Nanoarchaeia archaeon]|nr:PAC2 family protein [Candidatus Nanoarchaeia archaeon]MDD5238926.1 PAC2 family protein [Candidatus Nanoarchaeia archaeon]